MMEVSSIVRKSKIEMRTCRVCGVEFKTNPRGRKRQYCSKECLAIADKRRRKAGVRHRI